MAISFVGAASGVDTATLPAHQAGDVILVFAYNDSAATIPTIASGFSTIQAPTAGNSNGHRLAFRIAAAAGEALGTWANATQILALVYRGCDPNGPIGASANLSNVADVTYPGLALQGAASWVVGMHGRRTGNQENVSLPAGTVLRGDTGPSGAGRVVGIDTNASVSSWPATASGGSNTFRYRSISVELKPAPAAEKRTGTLTATLAAMTSTATGRLTVRASADRAFEPMTSASVGKASLRGRVDGRLGALTAEGVGRVAVRGRVDASFAAMTSEAGGRLAGQGGLSASFAPMTVEAGGASPRRGTLEASFAPLTGSISGSAEEAGDGGRMDASFAPMTAEAHGRLASRGSLSASFAALTADAFGRVRATGRLAAAFGALTLVAAGRRVIPARTPPGRTAHVRAEIRAVRISQKDPSMRRPFSWPLKDADEVLDYRIDWSGWLDGDTIAASEWIVPGEIDVRQDSATDTAVTIWLGGGVRGRLYTLTNRITTASGRVRDQVIHLPIAEA